MNAKGKEIVKVIRRAIVSEVFFVILGITSAVISIVYAEEFFADIQNAGTACGFAVCAGLCFLSAAIIHAANILAGRRSDKQEPSKPEDEA